MIAVSLAVFLSVNAAAAPTIQMAVVAPADVSNSLVNRICAEAATIWQPAGVTFEWHRVESERDVDDWTLEVTIDDRQAAGEGRPALGWIAFTAGRPDRSIHLSRAAAENMMRVTPGLNYATIFSRQDLIGRALGRALAHELGHYLLQSKMHTSRGLMRGVWGSADWFLFGGQGLALTAEQRTAAFDLAWQRSAPAGQSGDAAGQPGVWR